MKKATDDLFRLIKSLTKSEKGYFKKFASRNSPGGKSNYISLFDSIDKMQSYDEDLLRKRLKDKQLMNQLSVYKVYLFNLILKALQTYGSFEGTDTKITEMVASARILVKKQMPKEALKLLKKAKEIAYKYDNEKALLEILFAQRNILMTVPDKHIIEKRKAMYEEQKQFIERLSNRFYYTWLSDRMVMYVEQKGDFRNDERQREIEKIMSDPYMKSISKTMGYSSRAFYYHTHLFYNLARGDSSKIHEYTKAEVLYHEQYRYFIDENPKNYISSLLNYLFSAHISKNRKDVKDALMRLASARRQYARKLSPDLATELFMKARNIEILIYTNTCELEKGRRIVKLMESELKNLQDFVSYPLKVSLLYNAAHFCFLDRDFTGALRFNNMVMAESANLRSDVFNFAKIFNLLVHYELGNFDHLEYIIENTHRYLKEKKSLFRIEELLMTAIRKTLNTQDKKEIRSIFAELNSNIKKISGDPRSRGSFEFFDSIAWTQSKMTGERYSDVKKRQYEGLTD